MSNGAGETGGQHQKQNMRWKLGSNQFPMAIAKVAVAQICESQGFQSFQQSALETLSDVAMKYVYNIGKIGRDHANLANRTECNVFDVIQGLEDLGSVQGFSGASDVDHCLGSSGTIQEIVQYVAECENIPCVYSIPKFPVAKDRVLRPSFLQSGEEPPDDSIPAWLPRFPGSNSNDQSLASTGKTSEKEQRNGNVIQAEMVSHFNGRPSFVDLSSVKGKVVSAESNPYLATPLPFGEKQVSSVILPAVISNESIREKPLTENRLQTNCISAIETFAPAIEAIQSNLHESNASDRKTSLLNTRASVQFKIGSKKKFLGRILDLTPHDKQSNSCVFFETDDAKEEKKWRAEKILKESLKNTNQVSEL